MARVFSRLAALSALSHELQHLIFTTLTDSSIRAFKAILSECSRPQNPVYAHNLTDRCPLIRLLCCGHAEHSLVRSVRCSKTYVTSFFCAMDRFYGKAYFEGLVQKQIKTNTLHLFLFKSLLCLKPHAQLPIGHTLVAMTTSFCCSSSSPSTYLLSVRGWQMLHYCQWPPSLNAKKNKTGWH